MRTILASLAAFCALFLTHYNSAACIQTSQYGSLTADSTILTAQTIETCNYAGEYATVTIPSGGTWTFESSVSTDYLYVTDASNTPIDSGITPVSITTTGPQVIRLHISSDANCSTQSSCRVSSVTKAPCLSSSPYGTLTANGNTFNSQTISACNYAGEYATVTIPTGGIWNFASSISTDFLVITSTNNAVLASGTQPVSLTSSGLDTVFVHIFTDANCGTQSSCRVTSVSKSPCLSNTLYPSSVINADTNIATNVNITTCNYAGEYAQVFIPVGGNWQFTSSDTGDFIVLTDMNNSVLASGQVPLSLSHSGNDTVRAHIFTDANCGTQNACRTTSVVRLPCLSNTLYPTTIDTVNTDPSLMTVSTCNYAGEYFEVVAYPGQSYEFASSTAGDIFFVTDTANNFLTSGTAPLIYNVTGTTPMGIRVHIFIDNSCSTQSSCRTTSVQCVTCPPSISATATSLCAGGNPITLTASDTLGKTYWFAGSCGSTPIDSGSTISVTPNASTWYFASNQYEGISSLCDSIEITVNPNASIAFSTVLDVTCYGLSDGEATASATGGSSPYSYSWSNAATSSTISGLSSGNYVLTVTDANGCVSSDTVTITEPDSLTITSSIDSLVSCNGFSDGTASVGVMGGTLPYSYSWSNSSLDTSSISGVSSGTFTVTVTDANGCLRTVIDSMGQPDAIASSFTSTDVTCEGGNDGTITASVTGGSGSYLYAWSDTSTTSAITGLSAGTYTLTVVDANGCVHSNNHTIGFMFNNPTIPLAAIDTVCVGSSITLDAGNAGSTYTWSNGLNTQTIQVDTAGTYTVDVTDGNGCSASHTITIIQEICAGISNADVFSSIETYPNPASSILNIKITGSKSESITIQLISLTGQQIESRTVSGLTNEVVEQFDVSTLSKGVYFMNFTIGSSISTQRIVIH